ncbi:Gfo/Idh/MocA family protein [Lysinibacillus sp. NPDC086135]|uniref:Gfo/Idh/MocA family protein n=1 Tax=Lysinibacillus sp. NPDC086135 TaxID=3364130 RepID=UPI0038292B6C
MTDVLIVGAGYMAKEYVKVLKDINIPFEVIGRSGKNSEDFEKELGVQVKYGGLEVVFDSLEQIPTYAIVATTLESLEENTIFLLGKGVKNILIEKPGAVTKEGMQRIEKLAEENEANVYIAYNRRFYASVLEAKRRIDEDGGLSSFIFEFTEWSHSITNLDKTKFQLNNWFIGNSTHVIDAAFFFGGKPKKISTFVQSHLDWHPKGSIYTGSGITENDILFSYHANWSAPGSWKLELLTKKNRYIFRPFEKLHVQKLGSISITEIELEDEIDIQYKPGLYEQTKTFLYKGILSSNLLNIKNGVEAFSFYEKINGGQV